MPQTELEEVRAELARIWGEAEQCLRTEPDPAPADAAQQLEAAEHQKAPVQEAEAAAEVELTETRLAEIERVAAAAAGWVKDRREEED